VLSSIRVAGESSFDVGRYAINRAIRIIPPYYLAIAFFIVFYYACHIPVTWPDVVRQLVFFDATGASHMLNPSFWTLPIEFRWYTVFPFLLIVWTKSPRAFAAIAVLAACSVATQLSTQDLLILPAFMSGIVAAHVYIRGHRYAAFGLPLSVIFAVLGALRSPANWDNVIHPAWQAAAFCFVISVGAIPWLRRLLSMKSMAFFGTASYSIYLVHDPLLNYLNHRGVAIGLAAACSVAAGIIFWAVAERPFVDSTPVRRYLLGELKTFVPRWLAFAGIPNAIRLVAALPEGGTAHAFLSAPSLATENQILAPAEATVN
jgi:peptidoglycan/LPS O-acetylase OafA/YrhL